MDGERSRESAALHDREFGGEGALRRRMPTTRLIRRRSVLRHVSNRARNAWLLAIGIGAAAVVGGVLWWMDTSDDGAPIAWGRLATADIHALAFDPADADRLLFGHHDGLLATSDGGRNWEPTSLAGSDAMNIARLSGERLQIAGHDR